MSDPGTNLFLNYENRYLFAQKQTRTLPVTIITGFLGSGKTTLLRHILENKNNLKVACAVNDFAALNIDAHLIANRAASLAASSGSGGDANNDGDGDACTTEVVELTNGCMCCSLEDTFKSAVWRMLQNDDQSFVDYLVIETSGVTDPVELIRTLEQKYGKMTRSRLDSVVTVVDCDATYADITGVGEHTAASFAAAAAATAAAAGGSSASATAADADTAATDGTGDGVVARAAALGLTAAAHSQLACADVVLLNKTDLCTRAQIDAVRAFIEANYSPPPELIECSYRLVRCNHACRTCQSLLALPPLLNITHSFFLFSFLTRYSDVPLTRILDVSIPLGNGCVVSHEATIARAPFVTSGRF
jgi:G3E family GTPase